jgi:hypothetical protein
MAKRTVYSFHEKEIFQELLKQEKVLTDCSTKRYGGTNASEEKNQAWKRIVESFNSMHGVQKVSTNLSFQFYHYEPILHFEVAIFRDLLEATFLSTTRLPDITGDQSDSLILED